MASKEKIQTKKYPTDSENYVKPDSGCELASIYLGKQSWCGDCPFNKCYLELPLAERYSFSRKIRAKRYKNIPL